MSSVSTIHYQDYSELDAFFNHTDINAALTTLDQNIRTIGNLVETTRIGQANYAFNAPVAPGVEVGQPVYWNPDTQRFELSYLQAINVDGRVYASISSEAWGLVSTLCTPERAHLLLSGVADVNLFASTDNPTPVGKFYLTSEPGRLSLSPDRSIICPTLLATGSGQVIFRPWFADTYPRYVPRAVLISTSPTGTLSFDSATTVVNSPSATIAGWLPADNAIFEGNAPLGAYFGYNWQADENLADAWPPLDPDLSRIYYQSGGSLSQGATVLTGDDNTRVRITEHGIWWMTNCTTQLPWDMPPQGAVGSETCPKSFPRRMSLEADFGILGSDIPSDVRSLKSEIPWVKLNRRGTNISAISGDLDIVLDPTEAVLHSDWTGGTALKRITDNKFETGPVVAGVRSLSPSLTLSGGSTLGGYRYGQVSFTLATSKDFDLSPTESQLFGATTESYLDTIAIGLPPNRNSNFVLAYMIPYSLGNVDNPLTFTLSFFAPATMTLPAGLTASYRILPAPHPTVPNVVGEELPLDLNYTPGTSLLVGNYLEATTDELNVQGGQTIYLRISRAGVTDGIGGELHVLRTIGRFL